MTWSKISSSENDANPPAGYFYQRISGESMKDMGVTTTNASGDELYYFYDPARICFIPETATHKKNPPLWRRLKLRVAHWLNDLAWRISD